MLFIVKENPVHFIRIKHAPSGTLNLQREAPQHTYSVSKASPRTPRHPGGPSSPWV